MSIRLRLPCHTGGRCRGCKCNTIQSPTRREPVTGQAIQVLRPCITNTYGGGVQCQELRLTSLHTYSLLIHVKIWEDFYDEPQYNLTDVEVRLLNKQSL